MKFEFRIPCIRLLLAEDGQNIFLHSINARCLIEEYGALDAGPLKITGQIIDFDCFTMTKVIFCVQRLYTVLTKGTRPKVGFLIYNTDNTALAQDFPWTLQFIHSDLFCFK